jgi:hypothetical protein
LICSPLEAARASESIWIQFLWISKSDQDDPVHVIRSDILSAGVLMCSHPPLRRLDPPHPPHSDRSHRRVDCCGGNGDDHDKHAIVLVAKEWRTRDHEGWSPTTDSTDAEKSAAEEERLAAAAQAGDEIGRGEIEREVIEDDVSGGLDDSSQRKST